MDLVEFPPPPSAAPLSRMLFESPWLFVGVLGAATLFLLVAGLREGRFDRLKVAAGTGGIAILLVLVSSLVTTPGEHAKATVRRFVEAVVAADATTANSLLAPDVAFHVGDPGNMAFPRDYLASAVEWATSRYAIESNRIRRLDAWTTSDGRGLVHLGCFTVPATGGPVPTQWVIETSEQPDGSWAIERMTWIGLLGRRPSGAEIPVRQR